MTNTEEPLVESVRDLGLQFLDNDVNITGQDGITSILLPGDKTIWIFGDTIEGPFDTIRYHPLADVLSNTGAIVPLQDLSDGVREFEHLRLPDGKRPRQLISFLPHEDKATHRLWAIHGACVRDSLYLFYHKITMDPVKDVFEAFTINGMGVARSDLKRFEFERLQAPDGGYEFWKGDEPGFGVFIQQVDDYLYLWGSLDRNMYLARVRPELIEDLSAYEYLVQAPTLQHPDLKPTWARSFSPSAPLFSHVPNEMSSSYNPYLERYISLTTYEREDKLVIRTAPAITGPWGEPEVFYRPEKAKEDSLFNAGKEHPEFARQGGKLIYMTFIDSSVYVPHLLEITLR
jgi:hypothetical protein